MAAVFTIADDGSEEVESEDLWRLHWERSTDYSRMPSGRDSSARQVPSTGRLRQNSESQVSYMEEQQQAEGGEGGASGENAPFRSRSQSAPAALWAAKKYGRQLRRMSDEFDSWLDKGELRKVKSAGSTKQMAHSRSWWSYLFSHPETETETGSLHPDNHSNRTE